MPKIIKDKQISDDQWQLLTLDSDDDLVTIAIPEAPLDWVSITIMYLARYLALPNKNRPN